MPHAVLVELEMPDDLNRFRLPEAVHDRLQYLLDRQDSGQPLTPAEQREAEVDLSEMLTLLRLRAERASGGPFTTSSTVRK